MKELTAGRCVITKAELIGLPESGAEYQRAVARLLASKGAPFMGQKSPKTDNRYEYQQRIDPATGGIVFEWKPRLL